MIKVLTLVKYLEDTDYIIVEKQKIIKMK